MATRIWTGSADSTTFATAGNWAPSGAPSNDDTLIINATSDNITGAATGLTGITLKVTEGFTGNIGSSTTYLDLDGPLLEFASGGTAAYITGTWTDVRVSGGSRSSDFLQLKGNASTAITNLNCNRLQGTVTLNGSATCTTITQTGTPVGEIDIKSGVGSLANITSSEGVLKLASTVSSAVNVYGGNVTISGTASVGTLEIDGGGVADYTSSGTITTLTVFDGVFSARDNGSASYTVTNATVHSAGRLDVDSALNNGVYTNPISMLGGTARFPVGSTITLA
jgi:hypothetical protein